MSNRGSRFWGFATTMGLTGMGLLFLAFVMDEGRHVNSPLPVFAILIGGGIFAGLVFGPVGKAIGRMLDAGDAVDDQLVMRVEDLEARLAELSMEQSRVAELEERIEFTERLMAQRDEAARLPRGEA